MSLAPRARIWWFFGFLLMFTGIGLIPGLVMLSRADAIVRKEFLARHGWSPTGPDRTNYGRYKHGTLVERYDYGPNPQIPPAGR